MAAAAGTTCLASFETAAAIAASGRQCSPSDVVGSGWWKQGAGGGGGGGAALGWRVTTALTSPAALPALQARSHALLR
jgi:hypothetical protein